MLLHAIITHTEDNCPGYHREKLSSFMEALKKKEELAKQFNIKLHFMLSAAPEHHYFALLETDKIETVRRFLMEVIPIPSSFKITPVQRVEDLVATWKPVAKS